MKKEKNETGVSTPAKKKSYGLLIVAAVLLLASMIFVLYAYNHS